MAVWCLAAVLLLATGSPSLQAQDEALAPADQAAFEALVLGQRMLATFLGFRVPPADYHVDFVVAGRFEETNRGAFNEGSYSYTNTGPDTGTVVFTYDAGNICTYLVNFTSLTRGSLSYTCTEGEPDETNWRLVDDPDYVPAGTESFSIPNLGGLVHHEQRNGSGPEVGLWAHPCGGRFDHAFRNRHLSIQGQ